MAVVPDSVAVLGTRVCTAVVDKGLRMSILEEEFAV